MKSIYYAFESQQKRLILAYLEDDKLINVEMHQLRPLDAEFAYVVEKKDAEVAVPPPATKKQSKKRDAKDVVVNKASKGTSRSGVSDEAKRDAVKRLNGGASAIELAEELGVSSVSIYNWRASMKDGRNIKSDKVNHGNEEWQRLENAESFKPAVTMQQFSLIKDCMHQEMSALEAANEMDIPLAQVNFVYQSKTYTEYTRLAREAEGK